jgi:predicted AlkP superfamily pyrophosphatase or phosphodiesterase
MDRFLIFWILYFAAIICAQPFSDSEQVILSTYHETADDNNDIRNGDPFVFLISIDGLRYDYIQNSDRFNIKIPNLKKLISHGIFYFLLTHICFN